MNRPYYSPNRDGKRPNQTGRPKQVKQYSEEFRSRLAAALQAKAKDLGLRDEFEALADLALNVEKHQSAVIAAAWKIITDVLVVREARHTDAQTPTGPQIYLPAQEGSAEEAQLLRERGYVKAEKAETDQGREDGQGPANRRPLKH